VAHRLEAAAHDAERQFAAAVAGLTARGHRVIVRERPWGGGQAIAIDWRRGMLIGASDGRKDGCALGY
jgi:gamma-glutamyltranspeptidase/glutathione hydrolase